MIRIAFRADAISHRDALRSGPIIRVAQLARIEGEIAIGTLLRRLPKAGSGGLLNRNGSRPRQSFDAARSHQHAWGVIAPRRRGIQQELYRHYGAVSCQAITVASF
jgi:hypothetical protein